jgi:hypothetical protein
MNEDFVYRHNPAYDPNDPNSYPEMIDPTRGLAPRIAERVALPLLRDRPIEEALQVIAIHRIAPPEWLAERMLNELKPRANAPTLAKVFVAMTAMADRRAKAAQVGTTLNLEELADEVGVSQATLDRYIAQYKAWIAAAEEADI